MATKTKYTQATNKIFFQFIKKEKALGLVSVFGLLGAIIFELLEPVYIKQIFDLVSTGHPALDQVEYLVLCVIGVVGAYWFFWRVATIATSYFQIRVKTALYTYCFERIHLHSYGFFVDNFAGSLVKKVGRYDRSFEQIADEVFFGFIPAVIRIVIVLVVLLFLSKPLACILAVWLVVYLTFQVLFSRYKLKFDKYRAEQDTKTTGRLSDTIANNLNIKLFASYEREVKAFRSIIEVWRKAQLTSWNLSNWAEGIQSVLMTGLRMFFLWFSIHQWYQGTFSVGDIIFVWQYTNIVFARLWDIGRNIRRVYEAYADADEMTEILLTPYEVPYDTAKKLKVAAGRIEFRDVSFAYPNGEKVFDSFNLEIAPGEKVAFVGSSGAGKTTLTKLLLRLTNLSGGQILVDGQDIARVTQDSLRAAIGYVPQEPVLFHRALEENVAYGKPSSTREEIISASKKAHSHEFIQKLSAGYKTFVGERGVKLSGGERQRVAIARAMLKNAPILVLDEATSALDSESEMFIQDALKKLFKDKTVLVVAHRLSTIMEMDRIIVLEQGKVVEQGSHAELLKNPHGLYKKYWDIQSGQYSE